MQGSWKNGSETLVCKAVTIDSKVTEEQMKRYLLAD